MRRLILALLGLFTLLGGTPTAAAFDLKVVHVTGPAYALVGPTGPRTYDNYGLNATFGFIVTRAGVVLIDSGASEAGGPIIERAVAAITQQPITVVINTGSQDHRWLGNGYFARKGARIVALRRTVATETQMAGQELQQLKPVLKDRIVGTHPTPSPAPVAADETTLDIGGVMLQLRWLGNAHFAGDAVVWLPEQQVLYSGDLVFVDRLLGVLPSSDVTAWHNTFHRMEKLAPRFIVPGHGNVCTLQKAQRETGAYLDWLVDNVGAAVDNWDGLEDTVQRLADAPQFSRLADFDTLHRSNINRTFVQLEARR